MIKPIDAYVSVFETRVKKIREKLEQELGKPKQKRSRHLVKKLCKEYRHWLTTVQEVQSHHQQRCVNCGHKI